MASEPVVRQVFIGRDPKLTDDMAFERKLYVIRKLAERGIRYAGIKGGDQFYICQPVAQDHRLQRHADVRNRWSSIIPTSPTRRWRARWRWCTRGSAPTPFRAGIARIRTATWRTTAKSTRCAATSTGCTPARRCSSPTCSATTSRKLLPIINEDGSDSAMFDNCLEFLVLAGRSLPHAMMMMIPEPWENHESMSDGETRVLRISLLPDGTVGRPGLHRVHRRRAHRRGARPQRPAPLALLRDQGRPRHHGLRSRRARCAAGARRCKRAACSRAACS